MRILLSVPLLALITGCGIFQPTKDSGDEAPPEQTEQVAPKSDADGVVVGGISSSSTSTQVLGASAGSAIAGASAGFPAGALMIDTDVTIQQGETLKSDGLETKLGLSSGSLSEAGPAVVVTADPSTNAVKPFSINLVTTAAAGLQATTTFVVVYKTIDADTGALTIGIIPTSEIVIQGTILIIKTTRFGVFQPLLSTVEVTSRVEQPTDEPIKTSKGDTPPITPPKPPVTNPPTGDKVAPTLVSTVGPDATVPGIEKSQAYKFVFSEKLNPASVVVGGSMQGSAGAQVAVSKTTVDGDTVTVTPPTAGWVLGDDKELTVSVKDAAGNVIATPASVKKSVVEKIYHVMPVEGDEETGDGTPGNPYIYISSAITATMEANKASFIYVTKGETSPSEFYVGIRMYGGFSDDKKWLTRDPKVNKTILSGNYLRGTTYEPPGPPERTRAVRTLSDYAVVDGFEVNYASPSDGYGIYIEVSAGLWRIENNVISSTGNVSAGAFAFYNSDIDDPEAPGTASLILRGNTIVADMDVNANGMFPRCEAATVNGTASAVIERNVISCGPNTGTFSNYAFRVRETKGLVRINNNVFNAGPSTDGAAYAIELDTDEEGGMGVEIRNNTLWAKATNNGAYGVYASIEGTGNDYKFENNSVTAVGAAGQDAYGIYVDYSAPIHADRRLFAGLEFFTSIKNNAFNVTGGEGSTYIAGDFETVVALNADTAAARGSNVGGANYAMGFVNEGTDFKLQSTSNLKAKGIDGKNAGWNFSGNFKDLAGADRGTVWSIGAYQ